MPQGFPTQPLERTRLLRIYLLSGRNGRIQEVADKNLKAFAKVQPKQIMTTCAGCYKTFKQIYPQYTSFNNDVAPRFSISERLIQEGKLKFKRR